MLQTLVVLALFLVTLFMILLVLVQRGRGGGLVGALGGMGGQSAFGTKAGDVFTKITIVTASIWILLSIAAYKLYAPSKEGFGEGLGGAATQPVGNIGGSPGPTRTPPDEAGGSVPEGTAPAGGTPPTSTPAAPQ